MRRRITTRRAVAAAVLVTALGFADRAHAAIISLEIASESRGQTTAPQQWVQLMHKAGVASVRLRGARSGDRPSVESTDSSRGEVLMVVGVLSDNARLKLPGGTFTLRDAGKLRDYFDRLKADGAQGVTEPTGNYGLTKEQFETVFTALSLPMGVKTKGQTASATLEAARAKLLMPLVIDRAASVRLGKAKPVDDEFGQLSLGTGLAILLRGEGLALAPQKPRGRRVELHVALLSNEKDAEQWPVGYEVKVPPRTVAPDLMQLTKVEIDGYSLAEVVDAIAPRLKLPVLWDGAALERHKIDPAKVQVKLPASKRSYKRIFEKLLFQARLRGELRTDEAGEPFYWIYK